MSQILDRIYQVDPNNSEAVKDALNAFIQNLVKYTEEGCIHWLRALENVINRFPKYCMSHRSTIEVYLTHFLSSSNYYTIIEAAKCAHVLQQVRPLQEKTATSKSCWREQMNALCNTAHMLVDALFPDVSNFYKNSDVSQKQDKNSPLSIALAQLATIKKGKKDLLTTRLGNVFVFIQAMLVEIYPVAKPVRPQPVLDVLVRTLRMSGGSKLNPADVTGIRIQALRTLDALIACLGSNLIPFSPLIFRIVTQTLRWSSENDNYEYRKVRCAAYSSLSRWLYTLRAHRPAADRRARSWHDELAEHIIGDVTPVQRVVQLTMSSQPNRHLSKKAKRKLATSMLQESTIASHMPGEKNKITTSNVVNEEIIIAALECTEAFFTVCGIYLKGSIHECFHELLIRECYNSHNYSSERAASLLRALEACRKSTPSNVPPPTQYCLQLYSTLLNSQHTQISKFCSQALLDIRLHLHCSPSSLNYAPEVHPPAQKETENRKKTMSERNRAVLESLLGTENMPPGNIEEINVSEPAVKKPRLEEVIADKISISSESVHSIEASDESETENTNDIEEKNNKQGNSVIEEVLENGIGAEKINIDPIVIDEHESKPTESTKEDKINIYEAATQAPLNTSTETVDEEQCSQSIEVTYDYPNTGNDKVTVLEKMEDENLPSTNETDDIQITCGQIVKNSLDVDANKMVTEELESKTNEMSEVPTEELESKTIEMSEVPTVNGVEKNPVSVTQTVNVKIAATNDSVTVEDMLADFVDEVVDDNVAEA